MIKEFGIFKATHDSNIPDTPQGKYIKTCCWVSTENEGILFESTLDSALETGKLQSPDDGDFDVPKNILKEIEAWANKLNSR